MSAPCQHPELRIVERPEDMRHHPEGHPQVYVAQAVCVACGTIVRSRSDFTPEAAKAWLDRDLPLAVCDAK